MRAPAFQNGSALHLGRGDVHVWHSSIAVARSEFDDLEGVLTPDERRRADRFHRNCDRAAFVVARGMVRLLAARYCGLAPAELVIECSASGKPSFAGKAAADGMEFNVSHTSDLAACVFAHRRRVGIDVEAVRGIPDADAIAASLFSPTEAAEYGQLPAALRPRAFLSAWTRKEAFLKAIGDGLSRPLNSFSVAFAPNLPPRLVESRLPLPPGDWTIRAPDLGPGHVAAVVCEGAACDPTVRRLRSDSAV